VAEESGRLPGYLQHCAVSPSGRAGLLQAVPCRCDKAGAVAAALAFPGVPWVDLGVKEVSHLVVPQEGQEG